MTEQDNELIDDREGYRRRQKRLEIQNFAKDLAAFLDLPDKTVNRAMALVTDGMDKKVFPWHTVDAIAGSCLYAACKVDGVARSLAEFMEHYDEHGERRFYECLKILAREFDLNTRKADPLALLKHIADDLGLPALVSVRAYQELEQVLATGKMQGKDPKGVVGGALYRSCKALKYKMTQDAIADACKVDVTTMRKRLKEMHRLSKCW